LRDIEKTISQKDAELQEMGFLNQKLQEELLKRNTQLASMEARLREMTENLNEIEQEESHRK
jgi:chaperonin cofactor prefoldin